MNRHGQSRYIYLICSSHSRAPRHNRSRSRSRSILTWSFCHRCSKSAQRMWLTASISPLQRQRDVRIHRRPRGSGRAKSGFRHDAIKGTYKYLRRMRHTDPLIIIIIKESNQPPINLKKPERLSSDSLALFLKSSDAIHPHRNPRPPSLIPSETPGTSTVGGIPLKITGDDIHGTEDVEVRQSFICLVRVCGSAP